MREMRDSGIEWIGEIPSDWKVERLQWHIKEIKEGNNPQQTTSVLSLTNKLGVIPYEEKGAQGNVAKEDCTQYKLAYPNTIVANSMNILIGSVGLCKYFGCVSPVYYVYKPDCGENLYFLNYIFQLHPFQKELRRYAKGIMEIRLRVSSDDILKRLVAFPSPNEQERIVKALDKKCSQVDALIANQEAQIEKLKAYKQSLITEVVTKGLDSTVPMKDSGVEWIGEIPEEWDIKKLKYVATLFSKGSEITKEQTVDDGDTPCVRYGEIYTRYNFCFDECATRTNVGLLSSPQYFSYGDVLFTCTGELVEEIGKSVAYLGKDTCLAGGDIVVMKHTQNPRFMGYALGSLYSQEQRSRGKAKLKVVHTSASAIGNILFIIPPAEIQEKIADYLDEKVEAIDRLIAIKLSKIEKLNEYKKSLIYEYVTGKKEVI